MKPRYTYVLLASIAFTTIALGVAILTYFSREPARVTLTPLPAPQRVVVAAVAPRPAPPPAPMLPSIRSLSPPAPESVAAAPVEYPPFPTGTVAAPGPGAGKPDVEATLSFPPVAPTPPPRPADLAKTPPPAPLPPIRPSDLASLAAEPVPEPQPQPPTEVASPPQLSAVAPEAASAAPEQPTPAPNAPLPPVRPAELAVVSAAPSAASPPAVEPAAPSALDKLARLNEPTLRPAPDDAFQQQTPLRFGMGDQVFVRIFKQEGQLELYLRKNGRYALYRTFPVCKWSGRLGPKVKEADYQSPEGFYSVSARQLHPHSNYHRAFNVGYPNAFDKQNGRTGGLVMVHGACKSVGCFAMTDRGIEEIYGFVEAALRAGQKEVQVHIFPFRMTDANIARETGGGWLAFVGGANYAQWSGFWKNLKQGYDLFEQSGEPPTAFACGDHYEFDGGGASCRRVAGW